MATPDQLTAAQQAVNSPEYQAALASQIDYDSTREGQRKLDAAIAQANDHQTARRLIGRKIAGAASRVARRDQVGLMPPSIRRGQPKYREYNALATAREDLARGLGRAAAEANVWGKPSPATATLVLGLYDAVAAAEVALGFKAAAWRHPRLFAAEPVRVPWAGGKFSRQTGPVDVMIVRALGVDASWRSGQLICAGRPDVLLAWGYAAKASATSAACVLTSAPDLAEWKKSLTA